MSAHVPLTATEGHASAETPAATNASPPPRFMAWYAALCAERRPQATPAKLTSTASPPANPISIVTSMPGL
jgi:hypothetical protein